MFSILSIESEAGVSKSYVVQIDCTKVGQNSGTIWHNSLVEQVSGDMSTFFKVIVHVHVPDHIGQTGVVFPPF